MKSRLVTGSAAVVLALVGAMLVFAYASKADDRALADLTPVEILVVKSAVPAGTPADRLGEYLTVKSLPAAAIAGSALRDLEGSEGKVLSADLVPGEQLVAERLVAPEDANTAGSIDVPKGLQEVSVQLEPQRVVGGLIAPGDHVGVFISFEAGGLKDSPGETTQLVFHKTLVTAMQGAPQAMTEDGEADVQALPEGSMLVTFAVDERTAQRIVFGAEFGRLWLSKEPEDAKESKPEVVQRSEVYR